MANYIEQGIQPGPESKERIVVDRFEPIDLSKVRGLQIILKMLKEI